MAKKKKESDRFESQQRHQELTRQRAETFFWIYYHIGPDRSLEKLHEICAKVGLKRALSTFKDYSAKFDWQNKLIEIDTKLKEERELSHIGQVQDMNESQAKDARNMRAIARAGMSAYAKMIQTVGSIDLSPQDIATLMREGTKIERLAMGEATDRLESMLFVYNVMIYAIGDIFKEINSIKNQDERARIYGQKVDELRYTKLIDYVKTDENTG